MQKISWLEWNKEAFEKAEKENKPVLLDIHGVWCHWCHVIDNTTYSDQEIIEYVNENFISIKVDTDKRPDINKRYNQGGWPTTAFLTPSGQIITGAAYIPPDAFKDLMFKVTDIFKDIKIKNHEGIKAKSKKLEIKNKALDKKIVDDILNLIMQNFDFDYGGFGIEPKFPMPDAIKLLLHEYKKTKNNEFLIPVKITLDNMKGIHDNVEGGFFRYSVTRFWSEPHYEKMLETNAGIISNYLEAYEVAKNEEYKKISLSCLEYLKNNLTNDEGGFYGSQDADEEYYNLNFDERKKLKKPFIDENIYTDFNSMMACAFFEAYRILKNDYCREFAEKTVKFLIKNSYKENFGMFHQFDGKSKFLPGILADNIYFIKALLDAFEATKESYYLEFAEKLNNLVIKDFFDKNDNAFFDKTEAEEDIGFLKFKDKPIIENSIMAENLLRLGKIKNSNEFKKVAENVLLAFSNEYWDFSIHAAVYGLAVEKVME